MKCTNIKGGRKCTVRGREPFILHTEKSNKAAKSRRMKALRRKLKCSQHKDGTWTCALKRDKRARS